MNISKLSENQKNIDVTEDFDYSGQSDEYIKAYKQWRKNPDNPYAYNYIKNNQEITFNDSEGFINIRPEEKEKEVLSKLLYIIGMVLLIYLFIEHVVSKIFIEILDIAGVNIHNSFINYSVYGGQKEVMYFMIAKVILQYCIPAVIIHKIIKMPVKAALPCKLQSGMELFFCISLSLNISVLASIPRAYSENTKEYFNFLNGYSKELFLMNQRELIIYIIFNIIVLPVISEFLFRGVMFQSLRQFGDWFAVILSSVFSAFMTHDVELIPAAFAVSVIASISILRSGTVFTAVSVHIINKIYLFSLTIIELSFPDMSFKRSTFMTICFLISLAVASVIWNLMNNETVMKKNMHTFLTAKQKVITVLSSVPVFTAMFLCIIIIIENILS